MKESRCFLRITSNAAASSLLLGIVGLYKLHVHPTWANFIFWEYIFVNKIYLNLFGLSGVSVVMMDVNPRMIRNLNMALSLNCRIIGKHSYL